jgi:hypothetical protein
LAQPFEQLCVAAPDVVLERITFFSPVSAVQPALGVLIDPVSRGPPAV